MPSPFECNICLQDFDFDDRNRQAVTLSCGHSLCRACILSLIPAKCPHDSTPFLQTDHFSQSYALRDALEAIAASDVKATAAAAAAAEDLRIITEEQLQFLADAHIVLAPPSILNPRLEWNSMAGLSNEETVALITSLKRDLPFKQAAANTAHENSAKLSASFLASHQELSRLNQQAAVASLHSEQMQAHAAAAHLEIADAQQEAVESQVIASDAQADADSAQAAAAAAQAAAVAAQAVASSAQARTTSAQAAAAATQTRAMEAQVQAVDAHFLLVEAQQQLAVQRGVMAAGCHEKERLRVHEVAAEAELQQVVWALSVAGKIVAPSRSMLPTLFWLTLGFLVVRFVDVAMLELFFGWCVYFGRLGIDLINMFWR